MVLNWYVLHTVNCKSTAKIIVRSTNLKLLSGFLKYRAAHSKQTKTIPSAVYSAVV